MGHTKKIYNHQIQSLSFKTSNSSIEIQDGLPLLCCYLLFRERENWKSVMFSVNPR